MTVLYLFRGLPLLISPAAAAALGAAKVTGEAALRVRAREAAKLLLVEVSRR